MDAALAYSGKEDIKIYDILYSPADRICYRVISKNENRDHMEGIHIFNEYLVDYIRDLEFLKAKT